MKKTIQFDKLKKLAKHLKSGQLGHKYFDMSKYTDSDTNTCGTSGCAIGECPIVFPRDWEFSLTGMPVLRAGDFTMASESGRKYFGLSQGEFDHLFMPTMQNPKTFGGFTLLESASREQVADNILAFCEKMQTTPEPAKTTEP